MKQAQLCSLEELMQLQIPNSARFYYYLYKKWLTKWDMFMEKASPAVKLSQHA